MSVDPFDPMPGMKQFDEMTRAYRAAFVSAAPGTFGLMTHPLAASASIAAFGIALTGQAAGFWLGTWAGIVEASRQGLSRVDATTDSVTAPPRPPSQPLKLVAATKDAQQATAVTRAALAEAEKAARKTSRSASRAADAAIVGAGAKRKGAAPTTADAAPRKPEPMARPEAPDDLKLISGVGPKLEQVLNAMGIWTYRQVAALSDAQIAWLDGELGFAGRITRDGWVDQARRLDAGN